MPTQAKKNVPNHHNDKNTRLKKKKKKKKESAKTTSRKDSQTGSDSTTEETNKKSKAKVIAFGRTVSSDSYPSSSSRENGFTSSCIASSTDGRSTSSSGENLEISFPTASSDIDCARKDDRDDSFPKSTKTKTIMNESLRWEGELQNDKEEQDRLRVYKMNRRKRYMALLHTNGEDSFGQFYA